MQAIILAAGKGTRLGEITKNTPKSLIKISGKPIIEHTLSSLPSSIKEVIIVTGYLGNQIRATFGNNYTGLKIKYVTLAHLLGTAYALWQTRPLLKKDKFLVLNGDDIYDKLELENMVKNGWAFGLVKGVPPRQTYLNIQIDKKGYVTGARYPTEKEMKSGIYIATGAYVLDSDIFKYKQVKITGDEYGLPQTILSTVKKHQIKGVLMKKWIQINTPEDVKKATVPLGEPRLRREKILKLA